MSYAQLKDRHRAERDAWHPNLSLRVHRALSWLDRAEQLGAQDDADGQFILLWIAFNAAYATEIDERFRLSEQETFRGFLAKLVELDGQGRIAELVWTRVPEEHPRAARQQVRLPGLLELPEWVPARGGVEAAVRRSPEGGEVRARRLATR